MKSKKKIIIATILSALAIAGGTIGIGTANYKNVKAEPVISEAFEAENVVYNSVFTLPQRSFSMGGETQVAQTTILSPSGKLYNEPTIILDEVGEWTIRFTTKFDRHYVYEESFVVYRATYEVSNDASAVVIGSSSMFSHSGDGLLVTLPKGKTFHYNNVIDLSGLTKADELIRFGMVAPSVGSASVGSVNVTLTDIYDDNNSITIGLVNPNNRDNGAYPGAACANATFTGAGAVLGHIAETGNAEAGYQQRYYCDSPYYGTYTTFSFDGTPFGDGSRDCLTAFSYDDAEKGVYCTTEIWFSAHGKYKNLVADLDDLDYSNARLDGSGKGFEKAFEGFTTGEVYLSVTASDYSTAECTLFIDSLYGADFAQQESLDFNPPQITVDLQSYDAENLPTAQVGKEYQLFAAQAVDNELNDTAVKLSVSYVKGGTKLYNLSITDEGVFIPDVAGKYLVTYTAVDGYGNISEKSFTINAIDKVSAPSLSVHTDTSKIWYVGNSIEIGALDVTSYSGTATVETYVEFEGQQVELHNNHFEPEVAGKYTVVYAATDYLGQVATTVSMINVIAAREPVLKVQPVLPVCFIDGETYTLPSSIAYDYYTQSGEALEIQAAVSVIDGNGQSVIENGVYTAHAGEDGVAKISYTYSSESGETLYQKEVPIITVKDYKTDIVKYFQADEGITAEQQSENISLTFTRNGTVEYAKAVPVNSNKIEFKLGTENETLQNNANRLDFYFKDTAVADKTVKISIFKMDENAGASLISVNNGERYSMKGDFYSQTAKFEFTLEGAERYVKVENIRIPIKTTLKGVEFDGFTDYKAYMSLSIDGFDESVGKAFVMNVISIADTYFVEKDTDNGKPSLYVDCDIKAKYAFGSTVATDIAYATDMLQENTTVNVTVISPSGEIVTSVDGELMNRLDAHITYEFVLSEYGSYSILYTGRDSMGMSASKTYYYYVPDLVEPSITLTSEDFTCNVNESVALPTATFSDNITETENLTYYIMYRDPADRCYIITYGKGNIMDATFSFNEKGVWEIIYVVYDQYYNTSFKTITVIVK